MNKKLMAKCIFVIASWIIVFSVCCKAKAETNYNHISEVCVYDKVLNNAEIKQIYENSKADYESKSVVPMIVFIVIPVIVLLVILYYVRLRRMKTIAGFTIAIILNWCFSVQAVEYTRIVFDVIIARPADADTITHLKAIQTEIDALKIKFVDINENEKTKTQMNICRHGTTAADNQPCDPYIEFKEIDLDKINEVELVTKIKPKPTVTPIKTK